MFFLRCVFSLCVPLLLAVSAGADDFRGSDACAGCHSEAFEAWQGSHHDLAMQLPTADTVLGDFDDARFEYNGVTTTFFRDGEKFMVRTDGEDGKLRDFPVEYVFGVYPLQQYLLPLSRGRLQALSVAWDARPADEGGQRWYHLYPDETVDYRDPLHWTGPYQNWNTRCAECHSTDVRKRYDQSTRSFGTTYEAIDVGCEACHGPGGKHIDLASAERLAGIPRGGFPTDLAQRGEWQFLPGEPIARRREPLESRAQVDSCARCHARRSTLGDYHYGADLLDTHRLSLLRRPLYYADGQILDEVYVYGSFLQSRMHQAGVVCSNCHEPHSNRLRAEGNGVCAQCHVAERYDSADHHHHPAGSAGAQCANCHMPSAVYMGVDARRDHSMRVPRPDLSAAIGTPNACTGCHTERDAGWARLALAEWGVESADTASHPALAFYRANRGDRGAAPSLATIAADEGNAAIWRATAMEYLGEVGGREAMQAASQMLYSDDPLLRWSTVNSLQFLGLPQRLQLLEPLFDDPVSGVRLAIASSLAGVPLDQLSPPQAQALQALFDEYLAVQQRHADMPSTQLRLGLFYGDRGDYAAAEAAYREALALNLQLLPAYLNLADLMRAQGRDGEARALLQSALQQVPENGDALHALGLLETRAGRQDQALDYLRRAAAVESGGSRHRFVYAIALHDLGKPRQAIQQLQRLLASMPGHEDTLLALANYSAELGDMDRARYYAGELTRLAPSNAGYRQLYSRLGGT